LESFRDVDVMVKVTMKQEQPPFEIFGQRDIGLLSILVADRIAHPQLVLPGFVHTVIVAPGS